MYISNLIPEEHRVLVSYFTAQEKKQVTASASSWRGLHFVLALLFFLLSLANLFQHFWTGAVFGVLGAIFLPEGHRRIEQALRFRFKPDIKLTVTVLLLLLSGLLNLRDRATEKQAAFQQRIEAERKNQIQREVAAKEKARTDNMNFYLARADSLAGRGIFNQAVILYDSALVFAAAERANVLQKKVACLLNLKKYEPAIAEITAFSHTGPVTTELQLQRATCYAKKGRIKEAIEDLKTPISMGNAEAKALYNKINPIRKRVAYYVTRCCDGTTSGAKGRGACSHHNGVCNWNDPVYEEYRQYE